LIHSGLNIVKKQKTKQKHVKVVIPVLAGFKAEEVKRILYTDPLKCSGPMIKYNFAEGKESRAGEPHSQTPPSRKDFQSEIA
jgi:hypothetical protein